MSAKLTYDDPREPTVKELLEDAAETIGEHTFETLEILRQVAAKHFDHQVTVLATMAHTGLSRRFVQDTLDGLLKDGYLEAKYRHRRRCGGLLAAQRFNSREAALAAVKENDYLPCDHCDEEVTPETVELEPLYWVKPIRPEKVLSYVSGDDWVAVYIDGELIHEGHSITIWEWLELAVLGITRTEKMECEDAWLRSLGSFPKLLQDVKELDATI